MIDAIAILVLGSFALIAFGMGFLGGWFAYWLNNKFGGKK